MNNNDLLKKLHTDSENISPTDKLNPEAIEESLVGVKRKNNKGIVAVCTTICIVCIAMVSVFGIGRFNNNSPVEISTHINDTNVAYDYSEIYKIVKAVVKNNKNLYFAYSADLTGSSSLAKGDGMTSSEYSKTNVQVDGIDEADVVKTDGKYIYSIDNYKVVITKVNNGKQELVRKIEFNSNVDSIYVNRNSLVVIANDKLEINTEATPDEATDALYCYANDPSQSITKVYIYDISNPENPVEKSEFTQSGYYLSSRMINNVVYLTTYQTIWNFENINKKMPVTYCPIFSNSDELSCIDPSLITISHKTKEIEKLEVISIDYLNLSSIDLNNPDDFADVCSVFGAGSEMYASHNNIYVTSNYWNTSFRDEAEKIYRFSIDGTEIKENGSLKLNGYILNQFSMDEYKENFRVVTEKYVDGNTVTELSVYDKNLKKIGTLKNNVGNENIESVRFDGDIAYFVTYENTDPLFTVDLSDPTSPKVLSELKITGFSEYLHPFGEDLLLGFGREADINGNDGGLKVSMFDVSDKTDVREIAKTVFGSPENSYSEAEYNHKAIYVDEENMVVGIPYENYENDKFYYILFQYDKENNKFVKLGRLYNKKCVFYYPEYIRGIKIGEYFYIVTDNEIESYEYDTLELYTVEKTAN